MSDESMTDEMTEDAPKRRGRPPKEGPDRSARESRIDTRAETGRRKRVPLGTPQQKLNANIPGGMVGRWVNDTPGRIQRALEAGYQFINDQGTTDDRESGRSMIVGSQENGEALRAFLMAIPREWYDEDQKAKQKPLEAFEDEIRRGLPQGAEAQREQGAFYNKGTVLERQ